MNRLAAICAVLFLACADETDAARAMRDMGFTEVHVGKPTYVVTGLVGCGGDDGAAFDARGRNPAGVVVNVTVCCGNGPFPKGCTVRSR